MKRANLKKNAIVLMVWALVGEQLIIVIFFCNTLNQEMLKCYKQNFEMNRSHNM